MWTFASNNVRFLLLTDLCRVSPPGHVLGPDGLLDAVHFLLVALAVAGGILLGLLQSRFQGLDPLSRSTKTLLQFRKLTAKVCIITHQLWDGLKLWLVLSFCWLLK